MSKKLGTSIAIIAIAALCLSAAALYMVMRPAQPAPEAPRDIQYVLYLGTNDKDTNQPVFTPDQAMVEAENILVSHFGGYTIQEANGGWADGDTLYQEYTLVIYLSDTTPEQVHAAADDMLRVFKQSSVLIQANETSTEFYGG